jgi:hypothetical protein
MYSDHTVVMFPDTVANKLGKIGDGLVADAAFDIAPSIIFMDLPLSDRSVEAQLLAAEPSSVSIETQAGASMRVNSRKPVRSDQGGWP